MGRRKLEEDEKKNYILTCRVTKEQFRVFVIRAKGNGETLSEHVRRSLFQTIGINKK